LLFVKCQGRLQPTHETRPDPAADLAQGEFGDVKVTIRPERVLVEAHGTTGQNRIPGMIERTVYLGSSTQLIINLAHGERLQAVLQNRGEALPFSQGTPVVVSMPPDALRVLPLDGTRTEVQAERG